MADRSGLTPRQAELLRFISDYIAANDGVAPSYREMAQELGIAGPGGVTRIVHGLIARGHLTMRDGCARSVTPTRPSNDSVNLHRCGELRDVLRQAYAVVHLDERCESATDDALHHIAVAGVAWGDNAGVARRLRKLASTLNQAATALSRPVVVG